MLDIEVFPAFGWKYYEPSIKKEDPTLSYCPSLSYINDYLFPRGDQYHHAIDIFMPIGTPVVAVTSGVMWANEQFGDKQDKWIYFERGGWHCYLKGDDGHIYYYAHMYDYPNFNPGERVSKGTVLGQNGESGVVYSCPHLHFACYLALASGLRGKPINPYSALKKAPVMEYNIASLIELDEIQTVSRSTRSAVEGYQLREQTEEENEPYDYLKDQGLKSNLKWVAPPLLCGSIAGVTISIINKRKKG